MNTKNTIHKLRIVVSFALLGAVLAGSVFGLGDSPADSARTFGAVGGGLAGVLKAIHLF